MYSNVTFNVTINHVFRQNLNNGIGKYQSLNHLYHSRVFLKPNFSSSSLKKWNILSLIKGSSSWIYWINILLWQVSQVSIQTDLIRVISNINIFISLSWASFFLLARLILAAQFLTWSIKKAEMYSKTTINNINNYQHFLINNKLKPNGIVLTTNYFL